MAAAPAKEAAPAKKAEEDKASGHQRESSGRNPGGLPGLDDREWTTAAGQT